jgi:C2 domain
MEKYVFTIKIIEAEDLKACDINGLSDPYVVIGDEFQKRLAKTRVVYSNLNPRWDETFDIVTQGPLNIVATIWDWDTLGDHDCVGRTSLKLDPSHFRDFLPREYWMDLDTQGRLLLRVSMEGERDDIQFYFGKAFRALKRTEKEMTRTITDKVIWQFIRSSVDANFNSCRRTLDRSSQDSDCVVSYLEEAYRYKMHSAISTATGLPQHQAPH